MSLIDVDSLSSDEIEAAMQVSEKEEGRALKTWGTGGLHSAVVWLPFLWQRVAQGQSISRLSPA
jgi:hypothetical protein